jgi:hypothetical protein
MNLATASWIAAITVVLTLLVLWLLGGPPRCDDGKVAVMGEGKWYCVEGTDPPTRAGG